MQWLLLAGCCLSLTVLISSTEDALIRNTKYGKVRGFVDRSIDNPATEFYSFKGIPYARPPTGKHRFKAPCSPISWPGVRNTIKAAEICPQIENNFDGKNVIGGEDCLYVNVYEPKTARQNENQNGLLPVMVWFHGGTFIFGQANATGPDYFMEKPVVIVTVQYRLNVFGFLSTKDEYASGNHGLKDQAYALRWVKENIKYFGGDPRKVTIFGESAGGASVLYHMISHKSRGYYHRAISQSGSSLNRWTLQANPKEMAFRLGKHFNIGTTNSKELIERLRQVDYQKLIVAAFNKSVVGFYTPYYAQPFAPSIEKDSDEAFLTESSFERLKNGDFNKVPYITGYNTEEGSFAYQYILNGRANISLYDKYPELIIPISMNVENNSQCSNHTLKRIKEFYFQSTNLTDPKSWTDFMSQELFVRGIVKTMELMHQQIPMYSYIFSYTGGTPTSYFGGTGHYQEIQFLWYPRGHDIPLETEEDKLRSKRLITLWTNFANTSNPTPENDELLQNIIWPKYDSSKAYLIFDRDLSIAHHPNEEHSQFWDELFESCGNPPYFTY